MAQYPRYPQLIIPLELKNPPTAAELAAARVLSVYFSAEVEFLVPSNGYKVKTPGVVIGGVAWEIKCPVGGSRKSTIETQFKGLRQSRNLALDVRSVSLTRAQVLSRVTAELSSRRSILRLILIFSSEDVVELKHKKGYTKK